jgi:hypothetical protein
MTTGSTVTRSAVSSRLKSKHQSMKVDQGRGEILNTHGLRRGVLHGLGALSQEGKSSRVRGLVDTVVTLYVVGKKEKYQRLPSSGESNHN